MNKTFREIIAIAVDLKAVFDAYKSDAKDGVSIKEWFSLVEQTLAVLNKHGVSVSDVQEIITEVEPLFSFLK